MTRPEDVVGALLDLYAPGGVRAEVRAKLVGFVAEGKPSGPELARRVREAVQAILIMAEYQLGVKRCSFFNHGVPKMLNRREFLTQTMKGSSLVALSSMVPQFVSRTAQAAAPGKDTILVVLEMTGGNDGLNTVIPYADDLYHKARPTLRQTKDVVNVRRSRRPPLGHAGFPAEGERDGWPSCKASATRTLSARTSRRWIPGSRPMFTQVFARAG